MDVPGAGAARGAVTDEPHVSGITSRRCGWDTAARQGRQVPGGRENGRGRLRVEPPQGAARRAVAPSARAGGRSGGAGRRRVGRGWGDAGAYFQGKNRAEAAAPPLRWPMVKRYGRTDLKRFITNFPV